MVGVVGGIWVTSDEISKAAIKTQFYIEASNIIGENELIEWLATYHGEAPGQQVMITFCNWGMDNKDRFVAYLNVLDERELNRVAWALKDSGLAERFKAEFYGGSNESINIILSEITK